MKKLFIIVVLLVAARARLDAATHFKLVWPMQATTISTSSTHNYVNPDGGTYYSTDDTKVSCLVPGPADVLWGYAERLKVKSDVAPDNGAGTQGMVVMLRYGSAPAASTMNDTNMRAGIVESETTSTDNPALSGYSDGVYSDRVALYGGHFFDIAYYAINTPAAMKISGELEIQPATDGQTLHCGTNGNTALATTNPAYTSVMSSLAYSGTENFRYVPACAAGVISDLSAYLATSPGAGATRSVTLDINSGTPASSPNVSFSAAGYQTDGTNTASYSAGNQLDYKWTLTGTPTSTNAYWSYVETPTTSGVFCLYATWGSSFNGSTEHYMPLSGTGQNATESNVKAILTADWTLTSLYVKTSGTPGSGHSYAINLQDNGSDIAGTGFDTSVSNLNTSNTPVTGQSFVPTADHLYDTLAHPVSGSEGFLVMSTGYAGSMVDYTPTPDSCALNPHMTDFSNGVDGATIDNTALLASTFGSQSRLMWTTQSVTSAFTFQSSSYSPYGGTLPTTCAAPWPGNVGTVGIKLAQDNNFRWLRGDLYGAPCATCYIVGIFRTDAPVTQSGVNMDVVDLKSGITAEFSNMLLQVNSNLRVIGLENPGSCGYSSVLTASLANASDISRDLGTGVIYVLRFTDSSQSGLGERLWLFNADWSTGKATSLTAIADLPGDDSRTCSMDTAAAFASVGYFAATGAGNTPSFNLEWGWIKVYKDPVISNITDLLPGNNSTTSRALMLMDVGGKKHE